MIARLKKIIIGLVIGLAAMHTIPASAAFFLDNANTEATKLAGTAQIKNNVDLYGVISQIIQVMLTLLGLLFLGLIIWNGVLWMTAQGDTDKVTNAKKAILQATFGLIIVLSAYSIAYYFANLAEVVTSSSSPSAITPQTNPK